jgi:F0F1-type ATP synthase assembly protein I
MIVIYQNTAAFVSKILNFRSHPAAKERTFAFVTASVRVFIDIVAAVAFRLGVHPISTLPLPSGNGYPVYK